MANAIPVSTTNGTGSGESWWKKEPVVLTNAVTDILRNALLVGIGFGVLTWTDAQIALVMIAFGSLMTLVNIIVGRSNSTPTANPNLSVGTAVSGGASVVVPNTAEARTMVTDSQAVEIKK